MQVKQESMKITKEISDMAANQAAATAAEASQPLPVIEVGS